MSEKPSGSRPDDGSMVCRGVIAGGEGNRLLKILKENGYKTAEYFQGNALYFKKKMRYLDITDVNEDDRLYPLDYVYFEPIRIFKTNFLKWARRTGFFAHGHIEGDYLKILKNHIAHKGEQPSFFLVNLHETEHTDDSRHDYSQASKWVSSKWYLNRYKKQVRRIKEYTEIILKDDPEAIILFIGDHGPRRFGVTPGTKGKLKHVLRSIPDSEKSYFDDRFKVFAAVRLPKRYGQISEPFSPSNVFVKIFEKIGYEGERLAEPPNDSYAIHMLFTKEPILRDGVLIKSFKD